MTPEMLTVCTVGVALAGLILTSHRTFIQRFERLEQRFERLEQRFERLEGRLAVVEREQAHLAGLLEGLREVISGHRAAYPPTS